MYRTLNVSNKTLIARYQEQWCNILSSVSVVPLQIARTQLDGATPGKRLDVAGWHFQYPYQYRRTLYNEIAYDVDILDWDVLRLVVGPLMDFLIENEIHFIISHSGGKKSVHIMIVGGPSYLWVKHGWKETRLALWHWILEQCNIPEGMIGDGKRTDGINYSFDSSVVNFGDESEGGKVMRDFGGAKSGFGYPKSAFVYQGSLPPSRKGLESNNIMMPIGLVTWNADKVIESLELAIKEPKKCSWCVVDMEHCMQHEDYGCGMEAYQYPTICRDCGKCYGDGLVKIKGA